MDNNINLLKQYLLKQQEESEDNDTPQMSELEAFSSESDFNMRKYLLDLIEMKQQIEKVLENEDISVYDEMQYNDALEMISQNINKARMVGILDLS